LLVPDQERGEKKFQRWTGEKEACRKDRRHSTMKECPRARKEGGNRPALYCVGGLQPGKKSPTKTKNKRGKKKELA